MGNEIDPLDQAAYDTVHEFQDEKSGRRGALVLAKVLGMKPSTLANKANHNEDFAHLNIHEVRSIMLATGDVRILKALAQEVGFVCVPLPHIESSADMDVLDKWADWSKEFGETAAAIKQVLKDGKITLGEIKTVQRELMEDFETGLALLDVLKGMAEPEADVVHLHKAQT